MAGFLGLEDLTNSRGELALVVQTDKKNFSIEAVASLPDTSISSVQDAYLSASLSSVLPAFPRHKGQSEQHYKRQNPSVLEPFVSSFSEKSTQLSPYPVLRQENVKILMKKYKPVAQKVRPIIGDLPSRFRIVRNIIGDPLTDLPRLSPLPPRFRPTGRYSEERKQIVDRIHDDEFLWPEERHLLHHLMMEHQDGFAWTDAERGQFREDFFPPVEIPTIPHTPWVLRNIPIPPGIYDEVCRIIKSKLDAGVYEPSNSSYRSRWFTVVKKDGKSLRLVHSLEPLNKVTIQHSGVPPFTEQVAEQFAGRACGGILDLFVGYDERGIAPASRDLTTFQTPCTSKVEEHKVAVPSY